LELTVLSVLLVVAAGILILYLQPRLKVAAVLVVGMWAELAEVTLVTVAVTVVTVTLLVLVMVAAVGRVVTQVAAVPLPQATDTVQPVPVVEAVEAGLVWFNLILRGVLVVASVS
jgi:hypothetical protein